MNTEQKITVGELRNQLDSLPDDHLLTFSGDLTFYRLKRWSDNEHIIEFNEPQGDLNASFKKKNPGVKVVFMSTDNIDWDSLGVIGSMDIGVR